MLETPLIWNTRAKRQISVAFEIIGNFTSQLKKMSRNPHWELFQPEPDWAHKSKHNPNETMTIAQFLDHLPSQFQQQFFAFFWPLLSRRFFDVSSKASQSCVLGLVRTGIPTAKNQSSRN